MWKIICIRRLLYSALLPTPPSTKLYHHNLLVLFHCQKFSCGKILMLILAFWIIKKTNYNNIIIVIIIIFITFCVLQIIYNFNMIFIFFIFNFQLKSFSCLLISCLDAEITKIKNKTKIYTQKSMKSFYLCEFIFLNLNFCCFFSSYFCLLL